MADVGLFLQEYLNKVLREHKYVNPEITIEATSSGGGNYTSKLYTAVAREAGKEDLHLFAKVAIAGENMRKEFAGIYETENYAYTKLIKFYETVERECGVLEEDRLVFCKFYGFDPSLYREILVLENLLPQGYGPHDRFHSIDWPYAAAAVRELAKFHALSFAFAKRHPEEFEKTLATLKGIWETLPFEILEPQRIECAVNVLNPKILDKFMNYMKGGQFPVVNLWKPSRFKAIIHGDYRGNNLLHRVRKTLERESQVPEEDRLVFCKFYGFDPSLYREIMVLENLLPQGYGPHDRFHSIDWPYAAAAVRELAKMHALSFAFAKRHPEEFEKAFSSLKGIWETWSWDQVEPYRIQAAVKVLNPKHLDVFTKCMNTHQFPVLNLWKCNTFRVIMHGDYRVDNLLYRLREVSFTR